MQRHPVESLSDEALLFPYILVDPYCNSAEKISSFV